MPLEKEIFISRIAALAFVICLPVALLFIILPTRTLVRQRLRWGAVAFVGLGSLFVGWASSWPGPNTITAVMMFGGLITFATGSFCLTRSLCSKRR